MSIDHRLIERRKTVAEDNAKRNLTRLLKFLAVVVLAGGMVWLVFSPWLSVSMVTTTGIEASDGHAILAEESVVAGTPMILISASRVEAKLLQDPWVSEASVDMHWPDEVTVDVVERVPSAWVNTEGGWTRRATDGVALPSPVEPDREMARIDMPELADSEAAQSSDLLGALEFVDALGSNLHQETVITRIDDELWASVGEYQVRLGRAVDMSEKARSLQALLGLNPPEGSTLVVIAPTNPSVKGPDGTTDETAANGDEDSDQAGEAESGETSDENDDS